MKKTRAFLVLMAALLFATQAFAEEGLIFSKNCGCPEVGEVIIDTDALLLCHLYEYQSGQGIKHPIALAR